MNRRLTAIHGLIFFGSTLGLVGNRTRPGSLGPGACPPQRIEHRFYQHLPEPQGEVASASAEQRSAAQQIGYAVAEIGGVTQSTAAAAEQLAATAKAITTQALRLRETAAYFRFSSQPLPE